MSSRRDANIALTVFGLVDDNPDTFYGVGTPTTAYAHAVSILTQYRDHAFSFIDAVVFHIVDRDAAIERVLTVDGTDFRSYRFAHQVRVVTPS